MTLFSLGAEVVGGGGGGGVQDRMKTSEKC